MSDETPPAAVISFDQARAKNTMQRELSHIMPGVLSTETIDQLRERKLIREHTEQIDMEPVGLGERVVGKLNEAEQALYIENAMLSADLDEFSKEMQARSFEMVAKAIREATRDQDRLRYDDKVLFPSHDEAEEFYALTTRLEYLRALYNQSIRERFGHSSILGVRVGFEVVRVRSRYEIPEEVVNGSNRAS